MGAILISLLMDLHMDQALSIGKESVHGQRKAKKSLFLQLDQDMKTHVLGITQKLKMIDIKRPWNSANKKDRQNGAYYDNMWSAGLEIEPEIISITSFNEWHEGTQIEPAIPKNITGYTYLDYQPLEPDYYLKRTKYWIDKYDPVT